MNYKGALDIARDFLMLHGLRANGAKILFFFVQTKLDFKAKEIAQFRSLFG